MNIIYSEKGNLSVPIKAPLPMSGDYLTNNAKSLKQFLGNNSYTALKKLGIKLNKIKGFKAATSLFDPIDPIDPKL